MRKMELILREEDAAHWVYRGEGAVNLVLAYTGSSPSFIGKVMRIHKVPRNGSKGVEGSSFALTPHERLVWKDVGELICCSDKEIAGHQYVQHVMKPLLGSNYVDAGVHVLVSREFLESIEKDIINQRPAWRVEAAQVDTHCDFGLLMSDHSLFTDGSQGSGPCISVEIKPKCGFLPLSRFISEGTAIKRRITRFEMHQALKLHQGEISQRSAYNPLDLFSGTKERIRKAIKDLFTTPQNNFRVFLNGSLILGGLGGIAKNTNICIAKAFEDELKSVILADSGLCTENLFTLISEAVQKSGALDRLLEVQKLDNNIDIEGAIHAYYDITSQECKVCRELSEEEAKRYTSLHSASLDESLRIVKDFLIAATAKDCSLILCFRPRKEDSESVYSNVYLESTKQAFDFKVYFIDLDLKPLSKMEEYYKLDKKIVSCYREMIQMDQAMK